MDLSSRTRAGLALIIGVAALAVTVRDQKLREAQEAAQQAQQRKTEQAQTQPKGPATQVIALWTGVPVPGEPLGVHVADVSVDTAGAVALVLADNSTTTAKVQAAIAQARLQPGLAMAAPAVSTAAAAQYAEAVAQFLGAQTGFKPQLEGAPR